MKAQNDSSLYTREPLGRSRAIASSQHSPKKVNHFPEAVSLQIVRILDWFCVAILWASGVTAEGIGGYGISEVDIRFPVFH